MNFLLVLLQTITTTPDSDSLPAITAYSLEYYAALIERYGISTIFVIVFLLFFWYQYRQNYGRDTARFDDLNKRYEGLVAMILEVKNKVPPPIEESVEKVTHLTLTIRSIMKEAQSDFKPDYLHLWQFHDGVTLIGSGRIPYMYMAMTQEMILGDLEPVQPQFIGTPLTFVANLIGVLIDNPLLIKRANPEGTSDNPISLVMFSKGITTQEFLQITDVDNELVAVLEFCFISPPVFDDDRRNAMKRYAQRIGLALASYSSRVE